MQNLGNGGGVVNEGEGGVGEVGVTDIDGLGGGNVGVDGYGREGDSEETSITSGIFGGSEDDLLGGEARRGGCGNWGELIRGGRHSCELAPSCLSSSSLQHHFLVLLAGGGAISGKESDVNGSGVENVVSSGDMVSSGEGWVSCTDEGAGGCMSTEGEAAGSHRCLRQQRQRRLRSILVQVDGARRQHEMINS